jgi:hypothetical protein
MEISVAEHLVAIKKKPAGAYIIDCIWNMNPTEITQRTAPLVRYLLANGTKNAPIVLVEGSPEGLGWASNSSWPGFNPGNAALHAAYQQLLQTEPASVAALLHYVKSEDLYARAALYGAGSPFFRLAFLTRVPSLS